jgi:hypothetical protein
LPPLVRNAEYLKVTIALGLFQSIDTTSNRVLTYIVCGT